MKQWISTLKLQGDPQKCGSKIVLFKNAYLGVKKYVFRHFWITLKKPRTWGFQNGKNHFCSFKNKRATQNSNLRLWKNGNFRKHPVGSLKWVKMGPEGHDGCLDICYRGCWFRFRRQKRHISDLSRQKKQFAGLPIFSKKILFEISRKKYFFFQKCILLRLIWSDWTNFTPLLIFRLQYCGLATLQIALKRVIQDSRQNNS